MVAESVTTVHLAGQVWGTPKTHGRREVRGGGALRPTAFRRAAFGADVKLVQQMLGHASAAMTLDRYGHLFGDRLDQVAAARDAARAADVYPGRNRGSRGVARK